MLSRNLKVKTLLNEITITKPRKTTTDKLVKYFIQTYHNFYEII